MPARFILSLDCEGKWGVADLLSPSIHRDLTDCRLRAAYIEVTRLLEEYDIPATFAFVGLFAQSSKHFDRLRPLVDEIAQDAPRYVGAALEDLRSGSRQGWHGDWAVDVVGGSTSKHEIAFHGVTHVPWDQLSSAQLKREFSLFEHLQGPVRDSQTMVFPRNRVAAEDCLPRIGLIGYRAARTKSRLSSLASELNPYVSPDQDPPPSNPIAIPAGYFVNWQSGPRRMVPRSLSRLRAEKLIVRAAKEDSVAHFWLHPENCASAPETFLRLKDILEVAARARDAGHCVILTQKAYCLSLLERRDGSGLARLDGLVA